MWNTWNSFLYKKVKIEDLEKLEIFLFSLISLIEEIL